MSNALYLYNSLSGKKEEFIPINQKSVSMYVCGPTVYDRAHLGNARSCVVFDVLYRTLCHAFGQDHVKYCRNITDIEDKIIKRAYENCVSVSEIVSKYTKFFHEDMEFLGCLKPNIEPKATEYVEAICEMIQKLINNDIAYKAQNGDIFFNIAKYKDYGRLSGRDFTDQLIGNRVQANENKIDARDFVLWKYLSGAELESDKKIGAVYESQFGPGRPGWHIECSAMSYKNFGHSFDIHGGGVDLKFPHHENEIAQTCGAHKGATYARYWVHNGFLMVNGQKMSKSLGNFLTIEDAQSMALSGELIRYIFLMTHYRNPLNWSDELIQNAANNLSKLAQALKLNCTFSSNGSEHNAESQTIAKACKDEFFNYIFDDINTGSALLFLQKMAKDILLDHKEKNGLIDALKECLEFLGINTFNLLNPKNHKSKKLYNQKLVEALIGARAECKLRKDYQGADRIREAAEEMGVRLIDQKNGATSWEEI